MVVDTVLAVCLVIMGSALYVSINEQWRPPLLLRIIMYVFISVLFAVASLLLFFVTDELL
ncbi:hypothetical protein LCGC14_2361980 [marine sediment metagenome]|uniref:Uncharacterized protein n=1 Tax=marine sediment metagenome TaxID=412755 RepID=A0A0F9C6L9_9ZZZZ